MAHIFKCPTAGCESNENPTNMDQAHEDVLCSLCKAHGPTIEVSE